MIGHHVRRQLAQQELKRIEAKRIRNVTTHQSFAYFCAQQRYRIALRSKRRERQRRGLTTRGGRPAHMTGDKFDALDEFTAEIGPLCELHLTKRGYSR